MKLKIIIMLLITVVILIIFPKFTVDDSAILWRYADNFKEGFGLVWNLNEPLESYTGVTLLSLLIISPLSYALTAHIIGVISFVVGGWILWLILKDSTVRELLLGFYLFSPIIYVHVYSGLETVLFTTLTLACVYFYQEQKRWWLLTVLVVATLTRPEAVILSGILLISEKENHKYLLLYSLTIGIYLIWKSWYYGDILTNSFYYKSSMPNRLSENWNDLLPFVITYLSVPLFLIGYSIYRKTFNKKFYFVLTAIAVVIYFYMNSRLDTNYGHRFYFHIYPLILVIAGLSNGKVWKKR